uniref:WD repeat domain 97 n=1 Tax=Capra hircus TaxID=9925 RepID=A0A8C2RHY0_CAPHI
MESEVLDASNPFIVEGDHLILDQDPYETDIYEVPDPGFLKEERGERAPQLITNNSRWQNMALSARARQLWLLLRTGLQTFVEKEKRAELRVARLTHGLEPLRHLEVAAGLCSVAQDPVGRRFVVLDGAGRLHLHREDGWAQEKLLAPVALTGLVAVLGPLGTVGRFVGWGPVGLAILKSDLSLLWLSKPGKHGVPGREPICCLPVPDPGLLLVAEAGGSLVLWKFRSGGRCLVPHGSPLQLPPSTSGALARLALGPRPPHHDPCCFAAYGSAVLTFDLQTWALIDVRRNLHKTTIFDLAYCKEVEAMVTASRDSTVKVWEADWQIRMVFVGHRGPVTAVAVLPNTALVLSASQDGTLRTWDLQAAAQVGEVALTCWGRGVPSESVSRLLAPAGPGWPLLSLGAHSVGLWRARELYSPLAQLSAPVLHLQLAPALPKPTAPHAVLPTRLVCACADGSVYLVSVTGGHTVSALLLEPDDCAAAVAYCLPREALWVLTRAGHLLCANAARSPMRVLHRLCPPPPPAPQPCCLHLYSHLTDPASAFTNWEIVCQYKGELCRSDVAWAWKDKNRWVPQPAGGTPSLPRGATVAPARTGGDLTVKMWRVFPYAEESLSPLRTFCCCHSAVVLCALGKRVTVGFEDLNSATYGLVQFGLGSSPRYDHRPQDDPTDRITGLCCCPTSRWIRPLKLLHLNGAPQALTFCSNSGDLVLALGSRLCLVDHRLYLPTSYLLKKLCQEDPDRVNDPPLPLTSQESLTAAQLQRLANLRGVASLSTALCFIHRRTTAPQQPVLEEDLEVLVARNQDLQQLRLGLENPAARPQLTWQQRQQAFDNYLHLIYGPGMLVSMGPPRTSLCPGPLTCLCAPSPSPRVWILKQSPTLPLQDMGTLGRRFARLPRVPLPLPPTYRRVHSKASQVRPPAIPTPSAKDPILSLKSTHEDTARTETYLHHPQFHHAQLLWEQRYGHLPKFLQFFVEQNWFKKLFPIFTLQAYPKMGTVEGLASAFMDLLEEASWADRVHVLRALLRLLPDLSREFCSRLQGTLLHLLNLEQPPSLQDPVQKQFVMLALQLLLACSLESREVVLELMSYFLYSPAPCRPELRKLLDGLGLQDPQGFLFKEMMTWVQGPDPESKATLRRRCCQKLEEMIQQLQALSQISMLSGAAGHVSVTSSNISQTPSLVVSPGVSDLTTLEPQAQQTLAQLHFARTQRALSETLMRFCLQPEVLRSSAPAILPHEMPPREMPPHEMLPLAQMVWSQSKMLDLGPIDALNFFCEQQRIRQQGPLPEEPYSPPPGPAPPPKVRGMVVPQSLDPRHDRILRLQEARVQRPPMRLRGRMLSRLWVDRSLDSTIRILKLPLPRVELQPFPPNWPRSARPLPPRLLQPALQRYFLPDDTDPDSYR